MLEGNERLGESARKVLEDQRSSLLLPVTALAEACWVVRKGKTALSGWEVVVDAVAADARVRVISLDAAIVMRAMSLTATLEMHDAQIVATALIHAEAGADVRLLTCDQTIIKSGVISVVW